MKRPAGPANPTEVMEFRWPWRPYQARVLAALEEHLDDRRLHLVAAPGSGKTVLGIEVFRRLGRPAVVLSPTIPIRNQWCLRLADFLATERAAVPSWASCDPDDEAFFTSLTYQALYAQSSDRDEARAEEPPDDEQLHVWAGRLSALEVGTLILDEAHHLRRAWWRALSRLVAELPLLTVVSLTATPPADASALEWRRYEALCGPIDEEISVPELVRSGTLCPHQDYIWAAEAAQTESLAVLAHETRAQKVLVELARSSEFSAAVSTHPWVATETPRPEDALSDPELAVALLVFLVSAKGRLPKDVGRGLLKLMSCREEELPSLDLEWWEVLIDRYLFAHDWAPSHERDRHRDLLARRLRKEGLLFRRTVQLQYPRTVLRQLALSAAKIGACLEVHRMERALRGAALRQVILTDFIRDGAGDNELGAWPLFRALALDDEGSPRELALLTGRTVIVHESRLAAAREAGLSFTDSPVEEPPGFRRVEVAGRGSVAVAPLTALFSRGLITTLVGTASLLGEGWDAPPLNSLVMASAVGSAVLSNQMRGRALRRDPSDPGKCSSIWHIVALVPGSELGLSELRGLERRFLTFVGLREDSLSLESGLDRLALPIVDSPGAVEESNRVTRARLRAMADLGRRWKRATGEGSEGRVLPSVRVSAPRRVHRFAFAKTFRYGLITLGLLAGEFAFSTARAFWLSRSPGVTLAIAGAAGLFYVVPKFVRAARVWLRCLPVDGSLSQISLAVVDALHEVGLLTRPRGDYEVKVEPLQPGVYSIAVAGGSFYEQSIASDAIEEALGAIENPRYLITRRGRRASSPIDYHSVPYRLGDKKENAEALRRAWCRRVGPCELIYTRGEGGRAALLRGRVAAFSSSFLTRTQRLDRWH